MRRFLPLAVCLAGFPMMAGAQAFTDSYWQLLAIDGVATDFRASLRIDKDNVLAGAAPCNRWSVSNRVPLPALKLVGIRATRMACDKLAEEAIFFDALELMTGVALDGERNLILTGPDGRSMEFVPDGADPQTETCKTCKAQN
jgi:heat shock protein HslJ